MLIVGEQEAGEDLVSVRKHGSGDKGQMPVAEFVKVFQAEIASELAYK